MGDNVSVGVSTNSAGVEMYDGNNNGNSNNNNNAVDAKNGGGGDSSSIPPAPDVKYTSSTTPVSVTSASPPLQSMPPVAKISSKTC